MFYRFWIKASETNVTYGLLFINQSMAPPDSRLRSYIFLVKGESIEIIIFMRISDTLDFLGVMISEHGYRRRSSNEGIIARMS